MITKPKPRSVFLITCFLLLNNAFYSNVLSQSLSGVKKKLMIYDALGDKSNATPITGTVTDEQGNPIPGSGGRDLD